MNWEPGQDLRASRYWFLLTTIESLREQCVECGDCWEWQGPVSTPAKNRNSAGHPVTRSKGKAVSARRTMYELSGRKIRTGHWISTSCENVRCLNPDHLVQVSPAQQNARLGKKGAFSGATRCAKIAAAQRALRGKITMDDARAIRDSDETTPVLAERYGLSRRRIQLIRKGDTWREYTHTNPFAGLMAR